MHKTENWTEDKIPCLKPAQNNCFLFLKNKPNQKPFYFDAFGGSGNLEVKIIVNPKIFTGYSWVRKWQKSKAGKGETLQLFERVKLR